MTREKEKKGRIFAAVLFCLLAAGCGGKEKAPPPALTLSVNFSTSPSVEAGTPLLAHAGVMNLSSGEDAAAKSSAVVSKKGPWWGLVELETVDPEGKVSEWKWEAASETRDLKEKTLELAAGESAEALWLLGPKHAEKLRPGRYTLRAVLKEGGKTAAKSPDVQIEILEPGTPEAEKSESRTRFIKALYYRAAGQKEKALEEAEGLQGAAAFELRGDILLDLGRDEDALAAYEAALLRSGEMPSRPLLLKKRKLREKLAEEFLKENPDYVPPEWEGDLQEEEISAAEASEKLDPEEFESEES